MYRSTMPTAVIAVCGMLFGMILRYLLDSPLEATVANYLRSGFHGMGVALVRWATHLYFASRRHAAGGSRGAGGVHGDRIRSPRIGDERATGTARATGELATSGR